MPTSSLKPAMLGSPMQLSYPPSYRRDNIMIGTWSWQAIGLELCAMGLGFASGSYPASNRVLAFPFVLGDSYLVRKVWWVNGTTVGTNTVDVGVYSEDGATRLVTTATGTTTAGANAVQEVDITDVLLNAGRYWCAYVQNGTTDTPMIISPGIGMVRAMGCAQFAGAVPLGTTFTPAACASSPFPLFGIAGRTQVA